VRTNYNNFLVFVFSLIPGAGYMYLGLMQKGLEAMLLFWASVTIFAWIGLPHFVAMISIPLWFYFFFDTYAMRNRLAQGEEVDDKGMFDIMSRLGEYKYYYIGIGLLVIGFLALLANLSQDLSGWFKYGYYFKKYLFPVLLIAAGIFLLSRSRSGSDRTEDLPGDENPVPAMDAEEMDASE
jgi:hypothetical protein